MCPESVGLSGSRLQLIDRHLQQRYIEPARLPGALTLIERRGELAHFGEGAQPGFPRPLAA